LLTFLVTILHFQHVGHGVYAPTVAGLHRQRLHRRLLGPCKLITFLETEGLHTENVRVSRRSLAPATDDTPDTIAQIDRIAEKKVGQMRKLKRQRITRILGQHLIPDHGSHIPATLHPVTGAGKQTLFPVV
jgi:hypothetical protein